MPEWYFLMPQSLLQPSWPIKHHLTSLLSNHRCENAWSCTVVIKETPSPSYHVATAPGCLCAHVRVLWGLFTLWGVLRSPDSLKVCMTSVILTCWCVHAMLMPTNTASPCGCRADGILVNNVNTVGLSVTSVYLKVYVCLFLLFLSLTCYWFCPIVRS